jgi:ArsR family transcriptional regulator, arsenate/arsenite/antimonite-responsive transcriptional repressor
MMEASMAVAAETKQTIDALGALAHEIRLTVFRMLVQRGPAGLPAGVIAERLGMPPSSLTFHLQQLQRAGLLTQRRLSRQLIYAADFAAMNGLVAFLTENCCGSDQAGGPVCTPADAGAKAGCDAAPACASGLTDLQRNRHA